MRRKFVLIIFLCQYYIKKLVFRLAPRLHSLQKRHTKSYPATHLHHTDRWDYLLKFSSEAATAVIALLVVGFSFWLPSHSFADQSYAAGVLNHFASLNPKYYERSNTVKTTVIQRTTFIPTAEAQTLSPAQTLPQTEDSLVIHENSMVKPNPDTISGLISKQIKIYRTRPGDTISSIASVNNISVNTIKWANKLTDDTIKPGWDLLILPTSGTLHKINSNDTLPDIAKKYGVTMESIIAYNGLANAEDLEPDQLLIIKGGSVNDTKKKTASKGTRSSAAVGGYETPAPEDAEYGTGHEFPWGYCTYYVSTQRHIPWGGNAKQWLKNAKAYGAVISSEPVPGAIFVTTGGKYGHVAYVTSVTDTHYTIKEMNYEKFGVVSSRTLPINGRDASGFILP